MSKKFIIVISLILITIAGAFSYQYFRPNSQWQLTHAFKKVIAMPIDYYFNADVSRCGVWYESTVAGKLNSGLDNDKVKTCFQQAFKNCNAKSILFVKDQGDSVDKNIIYSALSIIRRNDQKDCIMQTAYEEQSLVSDVKPLAYINTCTALSDALLNSCEPKYIDELRKTK